MIRGRVYGCFTDGADDFSLHAGEENRSGSMRKGTIQDTERASVIVSGREINANPGVDLGGLRLAQGRVSVVFRLHQVRLPGDTVPPAPCQRAPLPRHLLWLNLECTCSQVSETLSLQAPEAGKVALQRCRPKRLSVHSSPTLSGLCVSLQLTSDGELPSGISAPNLCLGGKRN